MNDIKCLDSLLAEWFSYYDNTVIDTFANRKILNVCWVLFAQCMNYNILITNSLRDYTKLFMSLLNVVMMYSVVSIQ